MTGKVCGEHEDCMTPKEKKDSKDPNHMDLSYFLQFEKHKILA